MSQKKTNVGDALLDEVWHATARAPRDFPGDHTYMAGLDVLGAGIGLRAGTLEPEPKPTKSRAASTTAKTVPSRTASLASRTVAPPTSRTASMAAKTVDAARNTASMAAKSATAAVLASKTSSANAKLSAAHHAINTARKLAKHHPNTASKLASLGNRAIKKATAIKGDIFGLSLATLAVQSEIMWQASLDAMATAGDIVNALDPAVAQLKPINPALAQAGAVIEKRAQDIIDNNPMDDSFFDNYDGTIPGKVSTIQADATAWQAQALGTGTGTTGPAPFDPGSSGGGGGGGSDDGGGGGDSGGSGGGEDGGGDSGGDGSESSDPAVQRFRESGGADDPLDDNGGKNDDGSPEEADPFANAVEDDGGMPGGASDEDEAVVGLQYSDYHFEAKDLFMPHTALQRTMEETAARDANKPPATLTSTSYAPATQTAMPSPAIAKKLLAAQKRLAALQIQEAAMRAAQAKSGRAFYASQSAQSSEPVADDVPAPDATSDVLGSAYTRGLDALAQYKRR